MVPLIWFTAMTGWSPRAASPPNMPYRIPLIVTFHGTERGRWQGHPGTAQAYAIDAIEWWLSYEAWRVITVSRYMSEQLHADFNLPLDKIDVILNGVVLPVCPACTRP